MVSDRHLLRKRTCPGSSNWIVWLDGTCRVRSSGDLNKPPHDLLSPGVESLQTQSQECNRGLFAPSRINRTAGVMCIFVEKFSSEPCRYSWPWSADTRSNSTDLVMGVSRRPLRFRSPAVRFSKGCEDGGIDRWVDGRTDVFLPFSLGLDWIGSRQPGEKRLTGQGSQGILITYTRIHRQPPYQIFFFISTSVFCTWDP